jgi:hypothetical protein
MPTNVKKKGEDSKRRQILLNLTSEDFDNITVICMLAELRVADNE